MIDFKNIKVIKTLSLDEGDVYLLDLSTAEINKITKAEIKKKNPNVEKVMLDLLGAMFCDKDGKLLNFSREDFEAMPRSIFQKICIFAQNIALGEKKS